MAGENAHTGRSLSRADIPGALFCGLLVVAFCAVLLWRDPLLFWNDDYELSILPVFADVARSWSEGHLPLLSPYSWACSNLAGEFQYGTFSVFVNTAVVLIWKLPLTFPQQAAALSITHLFVLAMGGYLLGRGRNLAAPLAMVVGLIAALNGWIICWGAIDWFGALGAFAWFPWAWWGLERALDARRGAFRFLWPAPFVYLLICGGFPYTVVMLALLVGWLSIKTLTQTRSVVAIWPLAVGMLLGVGLSAPAWLALLDYVSGSARQAQDSSSHWQWIVPPTALPAFVLPAWTVKWADFSTRMMPHTATEMACGLVPPAALVFAVWARGTALVRQVRWELALLGVVVLISMLPTANVFRWSFRWLPFVHVVFAVCAAEALQMIAAPPRTSRSGAGVFALALVIATGIAMWLTNAAGPFGGRLFIALLVIAAAWALSEVLLPRQQWTVALVTFASLLATYLSIPPNCGVPKYNLDQNLTRTAPLDPQRLYLSMYPPPEAAFRAEEKPQPFGTVVRPGSTSMWGGVRFVNGYTPIRPAGVARELGIEIHGELAEWSREWLPQWEAGPDGLLAKIGVDGFIVANELELTPADESEWTLAFSSDEGRVYHRRGAPLPRVRAIIADDSRPNETFAVASIQNTDESRHRVVAEVTVPAGGKPALVSFSRPYFRGYRATLGNQHLPVTSFRGLSPAVEVPAGSSGRLMIVYRPWWLVVGGAVAIGSAAVWMVCAAFAARRR